MKIDTDKWTTQQALAKKLKQSRQVVQNWVQRGKIKTKYIPEWNNTLVDANHKNEKG